MEASADVAGLSAELHRRTEELARSTARFRDIIERNADAIVVVAPDGAVRFANDVAKKMFGDRGHALVGSQFGFPLVADETIELDVVSNGSPRIVEMRVVESEWEGETACIASLRDITERRHSEDDARRLIREQTARGAAEASARRLRFLVDSTTALTSSLDYATTFSALARICVVDFADWAVVYEVEQNGSPRRLDAAHGDPSKDGLIRELLDATMAYDGTRPIVELLRTRRPRLVNNASPETLAGRLPNPRSLEIARELGVASFIHVPMIARGHALGAITLVSANCARKFTDADVALAEDIAARAALAVDNARMYRDAQNANQAKTDFLAVLSHDLRTPLSAIIGYSDLLNLGIPTPIPAASLQSVERIRIAGKHLLYLLDELLAFARLDGGASDVQFQAVDLRQVLHDVATVMEPLAVAKHLDFRLELPAERIATTTDPDRLRQVLLNLVGNAVKYTRAGSVRVVASGGADGVASIEVRDTGAGIAQENLERIFEPFWQVAAGQRSHGGGTGLGLSIVRRTLDMLRAEVRVESSVGQGSTFTVMIPKG